MQDGPKEKWPKQCIANVIVDFLELHCDTYSCKQNNDRKENVKIFTFDSSGVSGHVNHIDTYYGLLYFHHLFTSNENEHDRMIKLSERINLQLMVLESISNPIVKYFPFVELLYRLFIKMCVALIKHDKSMEKINYDDEMINLYMFNPILVWKAMKSHYTQFVWYRRLFVIFSRYSYINTLRVVLDDRNDDRGLERKMK